MTCSVCVCVCLVGDMVRRDAQGHTGEGQPRYRGVAGHINHRNLGSFISMQPQSSCCRSNNKATLLR